MSHLRAAYADVGLNEILEARALLEVEIAGLAAQRATNEDLRAIEHSLRRMASRTNEINSPFYVVDADFHCLVAKAGYNRVLVDLFLKVYSMLRAEIRKAFEVEGAAERALEYHQMVFDALCAHDVAEARRRMYLHMTDIRARILEIEEAGEMAEGRASEGSK